MYTSRTRTQADRFAALTSEIRPPATFLVTPSQAFPIPGRMRGERLDASR